MSLVDQIDRTLKNNWDGCFYYVRKAVRGRPDFFGHYSGGPYSFGIAIFVVSPGKRLTPKQRYQVRRAKAFDVRTLIAHSVAEVDHFFENIWNY